MSRDGDAATGHVRPAGAGGDLPIRRAYFSRGLIPVKPHSGV